MAQDVIALWIPRIITSLERGRIHYNPDKDPKAGTRTSTGQKAYQLKESIKGLNWWNGWEETGREFQSGPGFMLLNCLVFLVGCRTLAGKRGILIAYPQLKQFFAELGKSTSGDLLKQLAKLPYNQQQKKVLQSFIGQITQHHFDAPTLEKMISITPINNKSAQALVSKGEKQFFQWLNKIKGPSGNQQISVQQAFDSWVSHYTTIASKGLTNAQLNKALKPLEENFNELIYWTNVNSKNIIDPNLLTQMQLTPSIKNGVKQAQSVCSKGFTEAIEKFSSTVDDLLKTTPKNLTPESWNKHLQTTLEKMISYKMPLSIIATLLGGLNHFYVSSVTQVKNRQYPANRLIRLEDLPNIKLNQPQTNNQATRTLVPSVSRSNTNVL
jgi:hypothetical protein